MQVNRWYFSKQCNLRHFLRPFGNLSGDNGEIRKCAFCFHLWSPAEGPQELLKNVYFPRFDEGCEVVLGLFFLGGGCLFHVY